MSKSQYRTYKGNFECSSIQNNISLACEVREVGIKGEKAKDRIKITRGFSLQSISQ